MTESGFWVGPVADPHQYRLTHLLGSGGEGEVWRARAQAPDEREYAVKIGRSPGSDHRSWLARGTHLLELRVPGIVRVRDVFVGAERHRRTDPRTLGASHRYIVMDFVPGLSLTQWLVEHPEAATRERIAVLRQVGRTLDLLHGGPGGLDALTHGDVKPANIVITPAGNPVIVDLGMLRTLGSEAASGRSSAYASPELADPNAPATPQTDLFAFAVTAVETITGRTPPVDREGRLDASRMRDIVRSSTALRVRPVFRRQLIRGLSPLPEHRPRRASLLFTAGRRALVLGTATALFASSGAAVALAGGNQEPRATAARRPVPTPSPTTDVTLVSPPTAPGSVSPSQSPSATAAMTPVPDSAKLITDFEVSAQSDPITQVAATTYRGVAATFGSSKFNALVNRAIYPQDPITWGGGAWRVSLWSDTTLQILKVEDTVDPIAAPGWLFEALYWNQIVAEPPTEVEAKGKLRTTAKYRADIDANTFAEIPSRDRRPFGVLPDKQTSAFVYSSVCAGNYAVSFVVTFEVFGHPEVQYQRTFGPYRMYGAARQTPYVTALASSRGGYVAANSVPVTGKPRGCDRASGTTVRNHFGDHRELEELSVQRIAQLREAHSTSSPDQVLELASTQFGAPSVEELRAICARAQTEPGWRARCWTDSQAAALSTTPAPTTPTDTQSPVVVP